MEWISVKERLPKHGERVLVHEKVKPEWEHLSVVIGWLYETRIGEGHTTHEWQAEKDYQPIDVIEWMPLPNPTNSTEQV